MKHCNGVCVIALIAAGALGCSESRAASTGSVSERLRYDGQYYFFLDQTSDQTDCLGPKGPGRPYSGHLNLTDVAQSTRVREEGTGCVVIAASAGAIFSADGANCSFEGAVSLRDMGILDVHYEGYRLDRKTGTWMTAGRVTRAAPGGNRGFCFEATATLSPAE